MTNNGDIRIIRLLHDDGLGNSCWWWGSGSYTSEFQPTEEMSRAEYENHVKEMLGIIADDEGDE